MSILDREFLQRKLLPTRTNHDKSANYTKPDTISKDPAERATHYNIQAINAFSNGFIDQAEKFITSTLRMQKDTIKSPSKDLFMYQNNLGCILLRKERYEKALELFEKAYKAATETLGDLHLASQMIASNIICSHYIQERIFKIQDQQDIFNLETLLSSSELKYNKQKAYLYIKILENYGRFCHIMSRYKEARLYMQRSRRAYEQIIEIKQQNFPEDMNRTAKAFFDLGDILYTEMYYEKALRQFEKVLEIQKTHLDETHLDIALTLSQISRCYKVLYNDQAALRYQQESFQMLCQIFPEDQRKANVYIADSLQRLGRIYYLHQDFRKAANYIEQAMKIVLSISEKNTIKLASLHEDLGLLKLFQNNYKEAFSNLQAAHKYYKKTYGQNHFKVAKCTRHIGLYHKYMEEYQTCQNFLKKSFDMINDIFGQDDPYLANIYEDIAITFNNQDLFKNALEHHQKALEIRKEFFGETSQFYATSLFNIGIVKHNSASYNEALENYEKALKIFQERLKSHNKVAYALDSVASCLTKKGRFDQAMDSLQQSLAMRKAVYGEENLYVAESYQAIGYFHSDKEEHKIASDYYRNVLTILKIHLDEKHSKIANVYNDLGNTYRGLGNFAEALKYYETAMEIRRELYGSESLSVANCHYLIGSAYRENFKYNLAVDSYKAALKLLIGRLGMIHSRVAGIHQVLGNTYYCMSNFPIALTHYQKTLEIRQKLFSEEDNIIIADSLYNIARILRRLGNHNNAVETYQKALNIYIKMLGEEHTEVASVYEAIGNCFKSAMELDKAMEYYLKSLELRKKLLGEQHRVVAQSYFNIGLIFSSKKEYGEALRAYRQELKIYEHIFGKQHVKVSDTYDTIAGVYHTLGDYKRAIQHYSTAYVIVDKLYGSSHRFAEDIKRRLDHLRKTTDRCSVQGGLEKEELHFV